VDSLANRLECARHQADCYQPSTTGTMDRMKSSHEQRAKDEFVETKMATLRRNLAAAKRSIHDDLRDFLVTLGREGERSAVVLGAERINVALEVLLKSFLRPPLTKNDALFASDGALSTFSRKIELAYRLGLIDLRFKQALDIVRKLRNDFAHATKVESLHEQMHADRVKALSGLFTGGSQQELETFYPAFEGAGEHARVYLSCIMFLLMTLEIVRHNVERPEILVHAKVDYEDMELS
jgi:hypothetical protein